jgi:hypothetical protein
MIFIFYKHYLIFCVKIMFYSYENSLKAKNYINT